MSRVRNTSFVFMVLAMLVGNASASSMTNWETVFNECILQGGSIGPPGSWPVPDNRCGMRFELYDCNVGHLWDACKDLCEGVRSSNVRDFRGIRLVRMRSLLYRS